MEHKFPTRTHGDSVVTLSSAGRARISLKHGLGSTQSRRSRLVAAYAILPHLAGGVWSSSQDKTSLGLSPFSCTSLTRSVIALVAEFFTKSGLLRAIQDQVRFARRRFGTYEVLDFVVVLLGYTVRGEPTLQQFYERLTPFASVFMALFDREKLPHRSTLSRFLAALDQPCVEALRALFQEDLVAQTAQTFPPGGLWDRLGQRLYRHRCRWYQTSRTPSSPAPDARASCSPSPL